MPLGGTGLVRHLPGCPQPLSSRLQPSSRQGVDNHSFSCSPAGSVLMAEITVLSYHCYLHSGVNAGFGASCAPGALKYLPAR